jgi:hypothetical protein
MAMQQALIIKPDTRRDLGLRHTSREKILRACNATMRDVRVRRQTDLLAERST